MNTTLNNQIVHADSTDIGTLPSKSADLIITSPPYNVGMPYTDDKESDMLEYDDYLAWTRTWMNNCSYWGKENARMCVNIFFDSPRHDRKLIFADIANCALSQGWKFRSIILWKKSTARRTCWGSWLSASAPNIVQPFESILVFHKGDWKRGKGESDIESEEFKDWTQGIWEFRGEVAKHVGHPAPFPIELPKRLIKLFSFKTDTILDPFMGSGTTAMACNALGRTFIGIEKEAKFVDLAYNRIGLQYGS